MKKFIEHCGYSLVEWLFRRPSPALYSMRTGMLCIVTSSGVSWAFDISMPYKGSALSVGINNGGGMPLLITYLLCWLGGLLLVLGVIWEVCRYVAEQKTLARKKVIVIEGRGLRDTSGSPLHSFLPKKLEGRRESILIDIRQNIKNGVITDPEAALRILSFLPDNIKQRENGFDRDDITIVYGGITPVPFTFLTGLLIDDEGRVIILDWDRHNESWRELNGEDDGKRFKISGVNEVDNSVEEVILAISVSYRIDLDGVQNKIGAVPVVHMELEEGTPDSHWSEEKQRALGQEFLNTVIALGNKGIKKINIFFAAPNSLVFRFGRVYDKRNLPEPIVYQYQREETPPYPWGILMPVHGNEDPSIIR